MSTDMLPNVDGTRAYVSVKVDQISEAFELGVLSRLQPKASWLDGLLGRKKSAWIDDHPAEVKRCLSGTGSIMGEGPAGHHWRDGQKVQIAVKQREDIWLDRESRPMLGFVEPDSLELRESDKQSEFPVIVELVLSAGVYEKLLSLCEEALSSPNTSVSLGMHWKFTNCYKSLTGLGSGASLWYPYSVDFYKVTVKA